MNAHENRRRPAGTGTPRSSFAKSAPAEPAASARGGQFHRGIPRWAAIGLLIVAAGAALAGVALLLCAVRLPAPPGPYAVGTTLRQVDPTSGAVNLPGAAGPRPIALQIWYPATNTLGARRAPYELGARSARLRMRVIERFVRTDSYIDVACPRGRYPVLVYVPGWGGLHNDNTALAQAFASAGFIVVALDDRYPTRPLDFASERAYTGSVQWADEKVQLQANVVREVLDALAHLATADPGGILAGRLDLTRVGIFGFSFGGAVAAQTARSDSRVKAAANLDGWLFGPAAAYGVPRPFLVMSGASQNPTNPQTPSGSVRPEDRYQALLDAIDGRQIVAGLSRHGGYLLTIRGTDHYNFSDVVFLPSLRRTGLGPLDGRRAARIVRDYIMQFFDHYLNERPAPLFEPVAADTPGGGPRHQFDRAANIQIWSPRDAWRGNRAGTAPS